MWERETEREREWDREHFLQRLQPSSLSSSPLQAPERTDGGGGAMKGRTDERRERWRRTWRKRTQSVKQSNFLKKDSSSPSSLHLSLCICPSAPPWSDPEYLTPAIGQRNSQIWKPSKDKCFGGCVEDWETQEERKCREEKMVKAEELRNTTRIHTELFGLPTYSQAGPGHEGLREWVRAGAGWKIEKFVIF